MAQKARVMKSKTIQLFINYFLLLVIIVNVGFLLTQQKDKFVSHDYWERFPQLKIAYYDSQYATKHPSHGWISDARAYSYAGGALIKGGNPILTLPDAPPLGKYLIGISAVLFNNENIIVVIFSLLSLGFLYLLAYQVLNNKTLSLVPPFLWSFEPVFKDQVINGPLFDIFQLVFLLLVLYFFNKAYMQKKQYVKYFILSFFFLGLFISTKFFASGIIMIAAGITVLFLKKEFQKLVYFVSFIFLSIIVLLFTYVRVFAFGYELRQFLGIQKWIFLYHKGQIMLPFSIWPLILFNKWHVWFGHNPVISDNNWNITWPIITLLSFGVMIGYLLKKLKRNSSIEILFAWIFFYFIFFSFGQIFSRYFVIVIPIFYIVALYGVKEIILKRKESNILL